MMSRTEAQLQALSTQLAHLASVTTRVETELRGHVERQTDRTARRDAQMAEVRTKLDEHERALDSVSQWRWMVTGRLASIMAGSAILGTGAATAATKLLGG
jgi:hypothetical protein